MYGRCSKEEKEDTDLGGCKSTQANLEVKRKAILFAYRFKAKQFGFSFSDCCFGLEKEGEMQAKENEITLDKNINTNLI